MRRFLPDADLQHTMPPLNLIHDPISCPSIMFNAISGPVSGWERLLDKASKAASRGDAKNEVIESARQKPEQETSMETAHELHDLGSTRKPQESEGLQIESAQKKSKELPGKTTEPQDSWSRLVKNAHREAEHLSSKHITKQLILTAKQTSLSQMPKEVQMNVKRNMELSPGIRLRWLGDCDCLEYLHKYYDLELARFYALESIGLYRGDLCRAAVLAREGGFYLDLDVQLKEPLTSLVDNDTTFMSGIVHENALYNAIMAATPGNEIISDSIEGIRQLYRTYGVSNVEHLGCIALARAIKQFRARECTDQGILATATSRWTCGKQVVRTFQEQWYSCWPRTPGIPKSDCPLNRTLAMEAYDGAHFGIFGAPLENKLIGWSRMEECTLRGCGGTSHHPPDNLDKMYERLRDADKHDKSASSQTSTKGSRASNQTSPRK